MNEKPTKIKIDIISDAVCPWCEVGFARLNKALDASPQHDFEVNWQPFQLHPQVPEGGMKKSELFLRKFGTEELSPAMVRPIQQAAAGEGITMNFDKIKNAPNTVKFHRLMAFARKQGLENELALAAFKLYFEKGEDIEDNQTLADAAANLGMDKAEVLSFLESDEGKTEVLKEEQRWREMGVQAVPTYIINDKYMVQGAQAPETFTQVFEKMQELAGQEAAKA